MSRVTVHSKSSLLGLGPDGPPPPPSAGDGSDGHRGGGAVGGECLERGGVEGRDSIGFVIQLDDRFACPAGSNPESLMDGATPVRQPVCVATCFFRGTLRWPLALPEPNEETVVVGAQADAEVVGAVNGDVSGEAEAAPCVDVHREGSRIRVHPELRSGLRGWGDGLTERQVLRRKKRRAHRCELDLLLGRPGVDSGDSEIERVVVRTKALGGSVARLEQADREDFLALVHCDGLVRFGVLAEALAGSVLVAGDVEVEHDGGVAAEVQVAQCDRADERCIPGQVVARRQFERDRGWRLGPQRGGGCPQEGQEHAHAKQPLHDTSCVGVVLPAGGDQVEGRPVKRDGVQECLASGRRSRRPLRSQ